MLKELLESCRLMEYKRVLCIQPHPDDNEIAAGGTIAQLCRLGAEVTYLTVTDGRYGYSTPEEAETIVETRKNEVLASAELLGVRECRFLDYPDLGFADSKEMTVSVAEVIRDVRPEVVLCADPWLHYEAHPDHTDAGMAAVRACLIAQAAIGKGAPWGVSAVAMYYTSNSNTWVDCTSYFDVKLDSIRCHKSQFGKASLDLVESYLREHMRNNGKHINVEYAEGFKLLPLLALHAISEAESL